MSTPLAVAAVTAVLRSVLTNAITDANLSSIVGGQVKVSALPPDRIILENQEPNQLNLVLYQTRHNLGWRNHEYPSRDFGGTRVSNPPLAINLHYLMSAYGSKEFSSEIILGYAMQALHEIGVLSRELIRQALSPPAPVPGLPSELAGSNLADQAEQITIVPEVLNTEEMFRIWSAMGAHYRPTVPYQVTVVLIEGTRSIKAALPIAKRMFQPKPFPQIVIEEVTPESGSTAIMAASVLLIQGHGLGAPNVRVRIGAAELVPQPADVRATQIRLPLANLLPSRLHAGALGVQVVHPVDLGLPPVPHTGYQSNLFPIVLRPMITPSVQNPSSTVIDSVTYRTGEIRVNFVPNVGKTQRVTLYLNEFNPSSNRPASAYSFDAPIGNGITSPNADDTSQIDIPFKLVVAGTYLVRVQVDGAESLLGIANGIYSSPQVVI